MSNELPMTKRWPKGYRSAAMITFDYDAQFVWADLDETVHERLGVLSNGQYGPTRGAARCLDLLDKHSIRSSWMIPGMTAATYPDQIQAIAERGHELGNHGWAHENFGDLSTEQQRDLLTRTNDAVEKLTGQRPKGFRTPAGELRPDTLRLLNELGFRWGSSTRSDDRPYFVSIDGEMTDVVEIPPHWDLDDFPLFMYNESEPAFPHGQPRIASYESTLADWKLEFDSYREEGLCYVIMFHPHCIGTPGRIQLLDELLAHIRHYDDVWVTTGGEVADWWRQQGFKNDPGNPDQVFEHIYAKRLAKQGAI